MTPLSPAGPHRAPRIAGACPDAGPCDLPLGVILAGGASRRFGSPKALAEVGGLPLIQRVRDALRAVVPDPVLVTGESERYAWLGLLSRPDEGPSRGPLSGLHAALLWARERRRNGALVVACDLPFLRADLLRRIVQIAGEGTAAAVAPEGPGRFGVEPLCAWYSAGALSEVEARLRAGDLSLGRLLHALGVRRVTLPEVGCIGAPEVMFHNVNTPEDRLAAERIARSAEKANAPV